ncbi:MAG: hypothetical protein GOMPHAMPRED_002278 [Gomphillus americanus]|uniref:Uncharacterized protein n=1 Tax=Gomphillus americanus TaxID=1940652 RepID=A0A8H3IJN8_9LECA|nr:MAG: hypothetical protein GOMPHAMPRED_002278 [Gomphillus americanus]
MQRDPNATNKARERERKEEERSGMAGLSFKPVKLGTGAGEGDEGMEAKGLSKGFKKGGFKSAFGDGGVTVVPETKGENVEMGKAEEDGEVESESDEELYDPRRPTGCREDCIGGV